jgi:hypothetical protein
MMNGRAATDLARQIAWDYPAARHIHREKQGASWCVYFYEARSGQKVTIWSPDRWAVWKSREAHSHETGHE